MSDADKIAEARALIEPLTGYTEGPWVYSERNTPGCFWIEPEVGYLPSPNYLSVSGPISRENAAVIAAAPALRDTVAALADLADAQAQEIARLQGALHEAKAALIEVKREMWREAQPKWTMADFLNWAIVQQITSAIARARAALGDTP